MSLTPNDVRKLEQAKMSVMFAEICPHFSNVDSTFPAASPDAC